VDSVTIDPHKLGYMPYQAGAVVFRDKRVRNIISYFAPYVFRQEEEGKEQSPALLGSYIFEGSKAGAAAATVWASHQCVGLNLKGYGKIIGEGIEGATRFYNQICKLETIGTDRKYVIEPLTQPDLNIIVYALNEAGNTDLEKMNALNREIKEHLSYRQGTIHAYDFIVSSTDLSEEEYGDTPLGFLQRLGIPEEEWRRVGSVFVLRSTIMSPYLTPDYTDEDYLAKFFVKLESILETVGRECGPQ
jgi:glutamate/tyrosine decarboxylase-like PLP-dependent enzyme